jgi:acyl dehydratase
MMDEQVRAAWPRGAPAVGQIARRERQVSLRDIELFTEISGDRNPLHYDPEFAAASPFGAVIVQGGVTTAVLNAVVAEDLPGPGSVFLNLNLDFRAPVRPGDTITGEVEVVAVRPDKPIANLRVAVLRHDGVTVVEGTAVSYTVPSPRG